MTKILQTYELGALKQQGLISQFGGWKSKIQVLAQPVSDGASCSIDGRLSLRLLHSLCGEGRAALRALIPFTRAPPCDLITSQGPALQGITWRGQVFTFRIFSR